MALDGKEIKPEKTDGDNFIRMIMKPGSNEFCSYFSWDGGTSYSMGNGGYYYFSEDKKHLYLEFGPAQATVEFEILRLTKKRMKLYSANDGYNLQGQQTSNIYHYKKVNWQP